MRSQVRASRVVEAPGAVGDLKPRDALLGAECRHADGVVEMGGAVFARNGDDAFVLPGGDMQYSVPVLYCGKVNNSVCNSEQ